MYVNYCVEHLGKDSLTFFISLLRYTLKCVGQYLGQNGEMLVLVTPLTHTCFDLIDKPLLPVAQL